MVRRPRGARCWWGTPSRWLALATGVPWANVNLLEFYLHSGILLLATLTVAEWVRRQGWARPHDAPLLSWEAVLGNLLRWPWVALGIGYAVCDSLLGGRSPSR